MKKEKMDFFGMAVMFVISLAIIMAGLLIGAKVSEELYKEVVDVKEFQVESFEASIKEEEEGYLFTYLENDTVKVMFTPANKTEIKEVSGKRKAQITAWRAKNKIARFLLSGHPLRKTVVFELDPELINKIK